MRTLGFDMFFVLLVTLNFHGMSYLNNSGKFERLRQLISV